MNQAFDRHRSGITRLLLSLMLTLAVPTAIGCGDDDGDGTTDGSADGDEDGSADGDEDGSADGDEDGSADGDDDDASTDGDDSDAGADGDDSDAGTDAGEQVPEGFHQVFEGTIALNETQADRFTLAAFADNEKFYAAGFVTDAVSSSVGDQSFAVARLNLDGTLDESFGEGGVAKLNNVTATTTSDTVEAVKGLVVLSDGKILVAGTVPAPAIDDVAQVDILIARLNADGTLDADPATGFSVEDDSKGFLTLSLGEPTEVFQPSGSSRAALSDDDVGGLAVDSQGRIVLFARGKSSTGPDTNRYTVRFSAAGVIDDDFGAAGKFEFSTNGEFNENAKAGEILENDVIVSPGYTNIEGKNHIVVFKLDANGDLVESFGDEGSLVINPFANDAEPAQSGSAEAYAAVHQSDGRFITTGYGKQVNDLSIPNSLLSFRFSTDGVLDDTYGNEDYFFNLTQITPNVAPGAIQGRNALVLDDDRIVQIGNATADAATSNADGVVLLLTKDGLLDTSFNSTGYQTYDFGLKADALYGLAKSPDGKHVVATGYSGGGGMTGQNAAFEDGQVVIFSVE